MGNVEKPVQAGSSHTPEPANTLTNPGSAVAKVYNPLLTGGFRLSGSGCLRDCWGSNLTQVDFMDCAGLRMLAAINQHIKTRGGSMRVVAASPAVTRLFELIASSIAPLEYHMLYTVRSAASTPTLP
jgi:ABC-type transporter Mla MlaB component